VLNILEYFLEKYSILKYRLIELLFRKVISKNENPFFRILYFILLLFLDDDKYNVGSLVSKPTFFSWIVASATNKKNVNNLGNPYSNKLKNHDYIKKIEKEIIEWNKEIINYNKDDIEGYVSSGGSESNMFLMWMGREYLYKKYKQNPTLIISNYSHYSLAKAGRILDLQTVELKVSETSYSLDSNVLKSFVSTMIKKGQKTFLIPLTVGYSSTGTSDSIHKITSVLSRLKKDNTDIEFFVWVDASAQGLVKSFLDRNYNPMSSELVCGYVVDFHKFGQTQLPAGVLLYKKEFRKYIETSIDYLSELDATLLGSRSGSSVVSIWTNIIMIDRKKWYDKFNALNLKKIKFIKRLKKIKKGVKIIDEKGSLTIAIKIDENFHSLKETTEDKFGLVRCNIDGMIHYKLHFFK